MKPTASHNETIKTALKDAGVSFEVYGETIWVNRDSMCQAFPLPCLGKLPEETAYPATLKAIRAALPKGVYAAWGLKNDDAITLDVYDPT